MRRYRRDGFGKTSPPFVHYHAAVSSHLKTFACTAFGEKGKAVNKESLMKSVFKLLAIVAIAAAIGVLLAAQ